LGSASKRAGATSLRTRSAPPVEPCARR
jgi:hypothetical protein